MSINWFPGHMHKAAKNMRKLVEKVDMVIEVLDARIPYSSDNPLLAEIRHHKPCIKILNKCDLADDETTRAWQDFLEQEKFVKTLALDQNQKDVISKITQLTYKLAPQNKNSSTAIQAMIMGIPNVGKSSLINKLASKAIAKTGNEPAVTKHQQQIKISDELTLFDTPGMLWPKFAHPNTGYRLALTGAIRDTAIDYDDVAFFAADYFMNAHPEVLKERYQINELPDTELELLEFIGAKRGCLVAGKRVDLLKVSRLFVNDYRNGSLGKMTLETPAMMKAEIKEVEELQRQRDDKKASRKQQFNTTKSKSK